jgi:hypothetical protein
LRCHQRHPARSAFRLPLERLPAEFDPPTTIFNHYNRWCPHGVWNRPFARLAAAGNIPDEIAIDTT